MDRWAKAVVHLNQLTQEGKITWRQVDPPDLRGTSDHVEIAFGTDYEGESLRIFQRRSKVFIDEDSYAWSQKPKLQVVDRDGKTLFEFPDLEGPYLYHLYETVQYQTSGIGSLLDKLAGDA